MSYPPQTDGVVSSELFAHIFYQPAVWIRRQRQNTSSLSEPGSTTHERGKLASRSVRLLFSISFSVVAALRQMLRLSMQSSSPSEFIVDTSSIRLDDLIPTRRHRLRRGRKGQGMLIKRAEDHKSVILSINGAPIAQNVGNALPCFQDAVGAAKGIVINFTDTRLIDDRFLGLLIMLNKTLKRQQLHLTFTGISPRIARIFRLNGFGFLLCI